MPRHPVGDGCPESGIRSGIETGCIDTDQFERPCPVPSSHAVLGVGRASAEKLPLFNVEAGRRVRVVSDRSHVCASGVRGVAMVVPQSSGELLDGRCRQEPAILWRTGQESAGRRKVIGTRGVRVPRPHGRRMTNVDVRILEQDQRHLARVRTRQAEQHRRGHKRQRTQISSCIDGCDHNTNDDQQRHSPEEPPCEVVEVKNPPYDEVEGPRSEHNRESEDGEEPRRSPGERPGQYEGEQGERSRGNHLRQEPGGPGSA